MGVYQFTRMNRAGEMGESGTHMEMDRQELG